MNEQESVVYSIFVGIDWADKKHDVCICPKVTTWNYIDIRRSKVKVILREV